MARTDSEQLVVELEARVRDFERNFDRANRTARRNFGDIERRGEQAATRLERTMGRATAGVNRALGSMGRQVAGGLVGALAIGSATEFLGKVREIATAVASISDEAQRAGLSTKAFQELGFVADQNRIPIDALIDGMKELNLRADEFIITGAGPAAEAFMRLGYSADTLKEKIKDPSALLVEMVGRLQQLDKAAQIRISDELFGGTAGERFVELIDLGSDGIRDMIDRANDLGVVMDDEMIAKAAEVDRKFREISMVAGVNLKSAIVEAASALDGFLGKLDQIGAGLAQVGNASIFKRFNDAMGYNDPDVMRAAGITPMPGVESFNPDSRIANAFDATAGTGEDEIKPGPERTPLVVDVPVDWEPITPPAKGGRRGGRSSRDREKEAADRQKEAVAELISELEREQSLIGATDAERRISDALRTAGAEATETQRRKIGELIGAIEAEKTALGGLKEAQEEIASITGDTLRGIADDFRAGADGAEILGNALDRIADKLINMAIDNLVQNALGGMGGGGGAGGLVGGILSLFGAGGGGDPWGGLRLPGRANGGPVEAGKAYWVGERGPEPFIPKTAGTIIPNHALAPVAPRLNPAPTAAAPVNVSVTNVNNAPNTTVRTEERDDGHGGRRIENIIDEKVAKALSGGHNTRKVMRNGWGARPPLRT